MRQHILRQDQYHGAWTSIHRRGKCAGDVFWDAFGIVDALNPFGHTARGWTKKTEVIDLLKRFTVARIAGDVADKQHQGRGILKRRVHANRRIGGTRPTRDKAHTGPTSELAGSLGHEGCTALLPVDDKFDIVFVGMKTVQHRQKTLTRNAKSVRHALCDQAFNQQVAS